ncbi:MAG: hypothetical protein HY927_12255 [Elusimicrobia bacterium]|nr:hypothetical protein [Elusimicrobiota bacterium]
MKKTTSILLTLTACLAWAAVDASAETGQVPPAKGERQAPSGTAVQSRRTSEKAAEKETAVSAKGEQQRSDGLAPAGQAVSLSPERKAAAWALETIGPEALRILRKKDYLIIQEDKDGARLQDGLWDALREAAAKSFASIDLAEAYRRFASGNPVAQEGETLGFAPLRQVAPGGLVTPDVQSVALLLIAAHEDMSAPGYAKAETASAEGALFDTPWGAAFAARTRADALPDPSLLADAFFDEHFAAVRRHDGAVEHFTKFMSAAYGKDLSPLADTDVRNASLSGELRDWLKKYLADQRRVSAVRRYRQSLEKLEAKRAVASQIDELETVAKALSGASGFVDGLKAKLAQPAAASPGDAAAAGPRVTLTSAGLHLHQPVKLGRHERGDAVVVTGAYWLDGLTDGETVEVEETTYADRGKDGADMLETKKARRSNGGPYIVKREPLLKDSRSFTFRSIVGSAEGNTLKEAVAVPVAGAFDLALDGLALADHQALDCRFKEAEGSYGHLEATIAEAAREKKTYADLLVTAQKRRADAAKNAAVVAKLEESIAATREDLSSQKCDYLTQRTEAAVKTIAALPAGCDRYLADLQSQFETINRRKNDQAAFQQTAAKARALEKDCRFSSAAENMTQALAILDADPAARCGSFDAAAKKLEEDLPAVRALALWGQTLDDSVRDAENPPEPGADPAAASLRIANAALARLPTLSLPACFAKQGEALLRAADSSGKSILVPADAAAAKLLPDDNKLVATSAAVAEERRKLEASRAAVLERKVQQELPPAEAPQAAPEAEVRESNAAEPKAAKPAAKPAPPARPLPMSSGGGTSAPGTPGAARPPVVKRRKSTAPAKPSLGPSAAGTPSGGAATAPTDTTKSPADARNDTTKKKSSTR